MENISCFTELSVLHLFINSVCSSFTLGGLFDFIFAHSWLNRALYFSLKNLFCEKVFFLINSNNKPYENAV